VSSRRIVTVASRSDELPNLLEPFSQRRVSLARIALKVPHGATRWSYLKVRCFMNAENLRKQFARMGAELELRPQASGFSVDVERERRATRFAIALGPGAEE
jgi:hypothetical protein